MKILLLMMLLTFTTLVASNEGEFEGRFVIEKMIKELNRIGFEKFLIPNNSNIKGSNILSFDNINQILKYLFNRD